MDANSQEPDWSRERKTLLQWAPSISLLASIRAYQHHKNKKGIFAKLLIKTASLRWRFWSVITGADIDKEAQLGGGLSLPHPNGIVIHGKAVIGVNCMIMQQVTIGMIEVDEVPTIGNNVYIGSGAKLLGSIKVGNEASIGANAVVIKNVPPLNTAVGVPAKNIAK